MTKEEIKKIILEKYPDIEFKNMYFLNEKMIEEFSLDVVALKLSQLDNEHAFKLVFKLDIFSTSSCIKDMIKYIVVNNIDYFSDDIVNINADGNIIKEYVRLYRLNDFDIQCLKTIEKLNIENNKDKDYRFLNFDINYYNELIIIQKLYKEGKIKYNDILPFIEFTFELLKNNVIREIGNYDVKYDNYINEVISHLLVGNISPNNFYDSMNNYNRINNLLIVSKFGKLMYMLANNPINLVFSINGKQIRNIYNEFCNINGLDKIKEIFTEEELMTIFISMSSLLGSDNVIKIIRHLPKDDIKIRRLFNAFKKIDLSKIKVDNKKILYNTNFINFFMGNNLNEPNSLLNLIYDGKTILSDKLESIYAYWDILDNRYKLQPLKTRLAFLEENLNTTNVMLNPDEYKLEGEIINSYYDNKKFQNLKSLDLIEEIRRVYAMMKHNYQKTIPYVNGEYDGFYYETILAGDPSLFMMGSSTDNCFKIGGDADNFVKYCAADVNGRVLAIKDKKGSVVAMAPMVRNGNLIICNSIESNMVKNETFMKKMFEVLEAAGNRILSISNREELMQDSIKALVVGGYKNEISKFGKYMAVTYGDINENCLLPLEQGLYVNMGSFDYTNYIISSVDNLELRMLRSFYPNIRYEDPRKEVLEVEKEYIDDNVKKIISSIYYEKHQKILDFTNVLQVVFNEDWFILVDNNYNIISCIVSTDPRAVLEYKEYLSLTSEYVSHYDSEGHIKDDAKYNYGR